MNDVEYDILMKFNFDGNDYVIYTDNTYSDEGTFNLYGAGLDEEERLTLVDDVDVMDVIDIMIERYRNKVLKGEL